MPSNNKQKLILLHFTSRRVSLKKQVESQSWIQLWNPLQSQDIFKTETTYNEPRVFDEWIWIHVISRCVVSIIRSLSETRTISYGWADDKQLQALQKHLLYAAFSMLFRIFIPRLWSNRTKPSCGIIITQSCKRKSLDHIIYSGHPPPTPRSILSSIIRTKTRGNK